MDDEHRSHAEEVLERFAAKQCRNMMYELRVSAVKAYYDDVLQQPIKDIVARKKLLREAQYLKVKPEWISEEAWCKICSYWCSQEFLKKHHLAQTHACSLISLKTGAGLDHMGRPSDIW